MAFCPNCGKRLAPEAMQCSECGKDLAERAKNAPRFKGTMVMTPGSAPRAPLPLDKPAASASGRAPAVPPPAAGAPVHAAAPAQQPVAKAAGPGKWGGTMLGTGVAAAVRSAQMGPGMAPTDPAPAPDATPPAPAPTAQPPERAAAKPGYNPALAATARVSAEDTAAVHAAVSARNGAQPEAPSPRIQATLPADAFAAAQASSPTPAAPSPEPAPAPAPEAALRPPPSAARRPRGAPRDEIRDAPPTKRTGLMLAVSVVGIVLIAGIGYVVAHMLGLTN